MNTELQNKAWQVLPKEFKEEVKDYYKTVKAQYRENFHLEIEAALIRERIIMLEYFFGIHNITSDAEGEDGLLTVPRSKVQEQYALNSNALREGNLTDMQTEIAVKVKDTLYYLFGSKCLPDDTKDDTKEPKPAAPKFKVGDWVKMPNGDIAEITAVGVDNEYFLASVMKQGTSYARWHAKDLEPYTEDKQETNSSQNENTFNYSGNHFPDVRKMVDTRLHIAVSIAAGWIACHGMTNPETISMDALAVADALIAECEKGGNL